MLGHTSDEFSLRMSVAAQYGWTLQCLKPSRDTPRAVEYRVTPPDWYSDHLDVKDSPIEIHQLMGLSLVVPSSFWDDSYLKGAYLKDENERDEKVSSLVSHESSSDGSDYVDDSEPINLSEYKVGNAEIKYLGLKKVVPSPDSKDPQKDSSHSFSFEPSPSKGNSDEKAPDLRYSGLSQEQRRNIPAEVFSIDKITHLKTLAKKLGVTGYSRYNSDTIEQLRNHIIDRLSG